VTPVVRAFSTRSFVRWAKRIGLSTESLCRASIELTQGLADASLGGSVFKKRLAVRGRGKRGGCRVIVAGGSARWFYLVGFAKNERADIDQTELRSLRMLAKDLLALDELGIEIAVNLGELNRICDDEENS
jgi:hypothetical protein